jgi:hypothetical protein
MHAEIGEAGKLEVRGIDRTKDVPMVVGFARVACGLTRASGSGSGSGREDCGRRRGCKVSWLSYLMVWLMSVCRFAAGFSLAAPAEAFTTHMLPKHGFGWGAHLT